MPTRLIIAAATACVFTMPVTASAQEAARDWDFTFGGGAGYQAEYEGSDNYHAVAVPVVEADYQDGLFFASARRGIGTYPIRDENYKLGASVGYDFGRDESDDRENLSGMGDVDESVTANLLGEYKIGPGALSGGVSTALSGDYGTTADLRYGTRVPVADRVTLAGSIGTTWADSEHMSNRFGVSAGQSAASGYAAHDAGAGFKSVSASASATYAITDKWSATATAKAEQFVGDAADSPLVKDELNPSAYLTAAYKF